MVSVRDITCGPDAGWQHEAFSRLSEWAARRPGVVAIRVHGSVANGDLDAFSDLDVSITSLDPAEFGGRFTDFVAASLAPVFASSHHSHDGSVTLRLVLTDLRRIDASITPPPTRRAPVLSQPPATALSRDPFEALTNDFLFEAVLAGVKAGRGDLLIASHLTLGLARHLLVGAMMLRDRDTGTRHHRYGGTSHDGWAAALGATPAITDKFAITGLIRRYSRLLGEMTTAFGRIPADAGPLLALLDAVEAASG